MWSFQLLLLCLGFLLSDRKNHTFSTPFCWKYPPKHNLCVNFIIFIISVIIKKPWSVFVPSLEITLSSLNFLSPYPQKIAFYNIFCLNFPKKCSTLGGVSQTLQMIFIINDSLSVLVWDFQLLLLCLRFLLSDPKNLTFSTLFCLKHPKNTSHGSISLYLLYQV